MSQYSLAFVDFEVSGHTGHYGYQPVTALHDSGCASSLMKTSFFKTLPDYALIPLEPRPNTFIVSVTGERTPVYGKATVYLKFNGDDKTTKTFPLTVHIHDNVEYDFMLGRDFTGSPYKMFETTQHLYLTDKPDNNGSVDLWESQKHDLCKVPIRSEHEIKSNVINIFSSDDIIIPPLSMITIKCEPRGNTFNAMPLNGDIPFEIISVTQPDLKSLNSTLFTFNRIRQISIPIFNNSLEDYYLPYGARLAQIKILDQKAADLVELNLSRIDTQDLLSNKEKETLASHHSQVEDLIAEDDLLTEEEKEQEFLNFINKGSYSIPMSSYIEQQPSITEMEYKHIQHKTLSDEEFLQQFKLDHLSKPVKKVAEKIFAAHRKAFSEHDYDLGKASNIEMDIMIDETKPRIQKFIPLPHNVRDQVRDILDQMIEYDIIRECDEPSLFCSNLLVTKKKDKTQIRILLDGRLLNNATVRLPTNLVTQMEVFSHLSGKKHVSTVDVSQAFFQVPLSQVAQPLTAFYSEAHGKRYCFKRSPQGLKNSPLYLKLLMDKILGHLAKYVIHYVDDILIATNEDIHDHLSIVNQVLTCLEKANIKIKPSKITIATEEIEFLGIMYKKGKLNIPEARVRAFKDYPKPKTPKQVKSFVCAMSYYRRFLPRFAELAQPLMDLTLLHHKQFKWLDVHDKSFQDMITAMVTYTSLTLPDPKKTFYVQTDASDYCGAGRVFQKDDEGNELLLACVSRTFTKTERKYGVFRKETLSLLYCLKAMDFYLRFANKVVILVDARAIIYLRMCKDSAGILLRFSLEISKYEAEIHHVQGINNEISDILSRHNSSIDTILSENNQKNIISEKDTEKILRRLSIPEGRPFTSEEVKHLLEADSIESPILKKKPPTKAKLGQRIVKNTPATLGDKKVRLPKESRWRRTGVVLPTFTTDVDEQEAKLGNSLSYLDLEHVTKIILSKDISKKMLIEAQKMDTHLRNMGNQSKTAPTFKYIDGVLYKKTPQQLKLALPVTFLDPIINAKHFTVMGLHFSRSRMLRDIASKFYVNPRELKSKLMQITENCLICQFNQNAPRQHFLQRTNLVFAPRVSWACDLIPSLPESATGHTAIFLAVDMFTGYVQLMPLKSKSSPDLIEAVLNGIIRPFGIPKYFRTDSETGMFSSKEFYSFMAPLGIDFLPCSIGAPWANGAAERAVQTVKLGLRKFIQQENCQEDWDKYLHFYSSAHNKSVNIFGYAPEALHFGFSNPAPNDLFQIWPDVNDPKEYAEKIIPIAIKNRAQAREHQISHSDRQITYKNKDRNDKHFEVGQLVLQKQLQLAVGPGKAMQPKFTGPYVIISIDKDEASCLIEHMHTHSQVRAHFSNISLLKFHPSHNRSSQNMDENLLNFLTNRDKEETLQNNNIESDHDYDQQIDQIDKEMEQEIQAKTDTNLTNSHTSSIPTEMLTSDKRNDFMVAQEIATNIEDDNFEPDTNTQTEDFTEENVIPLVNEDIPMEQTISTAKEESKTAREKRIREREEKKTQRERETDAEKERSLRWKRKRSEEEKKKPEYFLNARNNRRTKFGRKRKLLKAIIEETEILPQQAQLQSEQPTQTNQGEKDEIQEEFEARQRFNAEHLVSELQDEFLNEPTKTSLICPEITSLVSQSEKDEIQEEFEERQRFNAEHLVTEPQDEFFSEPTNPSIRPVLSAKTVKKTPSPRDHINITLECEKKLTNDEIATIVMKFLEEYYPDFLQ